jgi:hydrogenase maturation protease
MPKTLVVGYGNSLRGDDGVGWVVAEQLAESIADSQVCVLVRQQLMLELAPEIAQSDRLILIDAAADKIPGQISVEKIEPAHASVELSSHHLQPATLIACARQLYGSSPETWLVSVGGESFECSDQLSPRVAAQVPQVLACVRELIEK